MKIKIIAYSVVMVMLLCIMAWKADGCKRIDQPGKEHVTANISY